MHTGIGSRTFQLQTLFNFALCMKKLCVGGKEVHFPSLSLGEVVHVLSYTLFLLVVIAEMLNRMSKQNEYILQVRT